MIMTIQRSAAGIYTCEAIHKVHGTTRNSTVNVIVQSECHNSMCEICIYSYYIYRLGLLIILETEIRRNLWLTTPEPEGRECYLPEVKGRI